MITVSCSNSTASVLLRSTVLLLQWSWGLAPYCFSMAYYSTYTDCHNCHSDSKQFELPHLGLSRYWNCVACIISFWVTISCKSPCSEARYTYLLRQSFLESRMYVSKQALACLYAQHILTSKAHLQLWFQGCWHTVASLVNSNNPTVVERYLRTCSSHRQSVLELMCRRCSPSMYPPNSWQHHASLKRPNTFLFILWLSCWPHGL